MYTYIDNQAFSLKSGEGKRVDFILVTCNVCQYMTSIIFI